MTPQHLAPAPDSRQTFATLRSQHISKAAYLYLFAYESGNLRACHRSVALRQAGSKDLVRVKNNEWRQRCPRASKHSWPWALLPLSELAPTPHQSKNTSWLTQSRSRLSRLTPANTSNSGLIRSGQALRPVHTRNGTIRPAAMRPFGLKTQNPPSSEPARFRAPLQKGGAL